MIFILIFLCDDGVSIPNARSRDTIASKQYRISFFRFNEIPSPEI